MQQYYAIVFYMCKKEKGVFCGNKHAVQAKWGYFIFIAELFSIAKLYTLTHSLLETNQFVIEHQKHALCMQSSRFSCNSEANASELLENHEDMFPCY